MVPNTSRKAQVLAVAEQLPGKESADHRASSFSTQDEDVTVQYRYGRLRPLHTEPFEQQQLGTALEGVWLCGFQICWPQLSLCSSKGVKLLRYIFRNSSSSQRKCAAIDLLLLLLAIEAVKPFQAGLNCASISPPPKTNQTLFKAQTLHRRLKPTL
ncbi:hypothetical protein Anapl_02941 [Anas platyrhynchos]|uniref:Uncharacterized protein n=1 Tax=Anas platyrhynchos TaxID=8839 RepID=R0JN74_ANAPL|nr:hypothetical protein Anapl_02941 [Anas platyrhynchos]